jgi:hypothetical protein
MDVELALVGSVRDWTRQQCPDDPRVVDKAAVLALRSYAGGASVAEACEQVRAFVTSWAHHPAHLDARQTGQLPVAS